MKKLFTLALVVLGLAACQNEPEGLDVNLGEEQLVTVSVALPEGTRVASDTGADLATIAGTSDAYQIRYILEVYHNGVSNAQQIKCLDAQSAAFDVRLAPGRKYTFVVWADIVEDGVSPYYNVPDHNNGGLANISLKDGVWESDDNLRDAYTITKELDFDGSAINLTLTRPFAKVRVITTDYDDLAKVGIVPAKATVAYKDVYKAYNAVAGAPIETSKADVTLTGFGIFDYDDETGENTIFADYLFAKNEEAVVEFSLDVMEANGNRIKFNNFNTSIPVKRNTVTTIKGDVLTENGKINVSIDGEFTDPSTEVMVANNAADLQDMINNAPAGEETNITLGGNIDLNDLIGMFSTRAAANNGLTIAQGKTVVLDLNQFTITFATERSGSVIKNEGTLTVKNGTVTSTTTNGGSAIRNSGTLTLSDMTVNGAPTDTATGTAAYAVNTDGAGSLLTLNNVNISGRGAVGITGGAKAEINGGTYHTPAVAWGHAIYATDEGTEVVINDGIFSEGYEYSADNWGMYQIYSGNKAKVVVYGGTFMPWDCANGYDLYTANEGVIEIYGGTFAEDPSKFVDDEYEVKNENGTFTIVRKPDIVKIGDVGYASLAKAVAAAQNGDIIVFTNDVEQEDGVIITDKNITIDLNDKTFTVSNGANTNNRNFKVNGSSVVTIKNGTMVAAGNYSSGAYGTLRTEGTANVTLEDVKLYNYRGNGLNVKALSGTTVTINDTEIYSQYGGGVEAAGGTVELTNVKIEQEGMYTAPYNSMAISVNGGGTATVNSGTYSTECLTAEEANNQGTSHGPWCAGVLNSGGTLIIKGGTFSNDNFGDNSLATYARGLLLADTGANIQIQGGTFNAVKAIVDIQNNLGDASRNPSATILGGDFSYDPRISASYSSNLIKVATGYKVVENNGRWAVVVDPAAKIGNVEYATLQEAFNVGGEITLLRDITIAETVVLAEGKTVTLDLNGKTITGTMHKSVGAVVKNEGTLTVKNGTIKSTADNGGSAILNYGTIVVEDVTLNGAPIVEGGWPSYAVNNYGNLTVNSATINTYHGAIATGGDGVAVIKDATVDVGQSTQTKQTSWALYVFENGQLTVNNGTFKNTKDEQNKVYGGGYICATSTKETVINGGTFDKTEGDNNGNGIYYNCTNLIIKGGTFDTDPSKHISEGYAAVKNENGTWTVIAE